MTNEQHTGVGTSLHVVGTAKPERADAARNRRLLVDAAARLVRDHGVASLSMETVAAAAGVGVGTVYRRFGDRAGLAYALIDEQERDFQHAFLFGPPPLGPGAPPAQRLRAFTHAYVDRLDEQAELMAAAEGARYGAGAYHLERRHLVGLIREIDPTYDGEYLAEAVLEALSAKLFLHQRHDEGMSVERIKAGIDRLLCGVLG